MTNAERIEELNADMSALALRISRGMDFRANGVNFWYDDKELKKDMEALNALYMEHNMLTKAEELKQLTETNK